MPYHKTTTQIINLLRSKGIWFEKFEHAPVRTSEEAAKTRPGYSLEQGAKAIVARIKITNTEKKFVMLVIAGNARFDNDKVKNLFLAKDVRFANEQELLEITDGVLSGGVPPFGNLFGLVVVCDKALLENEKIVFNAGDRSVSVGMRTDDYVRVVMPRVESIV